MADSAHEYDDAQEEVEPSEADPVEQSDPSTRIASSSTSDCSGADNERAFVETLELLFKEFENVIRDNPQLKVHASNVLTTVLRNTKVQKVIADIATQAQEATAPKTVPPVQDVPAKPKPHFANPHPYSPIHHNHRGGNHWTGMLGNHPGQGGPCSVNRSSFLQPSAISLMHPTPSFARAAPSAAPAAPAVPAVPVVSVVPAIPMSSTPQMPQMPQMPDPQQMQVPQMPEMPQMPQMPQLPQLPQLPQMHQLPTGSLGRSNTIHCSRPSPFGQGFPFNTTPPAINKTFEFRSDRPAPVDPEASREPLNRKAKATDNESSLNAATCYGHPRSTSLSAVPSSSTMHEGVKFEAEEAKPRSLRTTLDEAPSTTRAGPSFPERSGLGPFRARNFRNLAPMNDHQTAPVVVPPSMANLLNLTPGLSPGLSPSNPSEVRLKLSFLVNSSQVLCISIALWNRQELSSK
ncbi:hypothetical protein BGZ65_010906 [Modicella reniformis]|uniref:Uncharacterized protein n=1 Tax=Modicella reniformis TaxID=1440133 RepID=A0A9P6IS42_9FUNG|nr:hypothetical protein BGZ65_010906 [Modicella reniformis]